MLVRDNPLKLHDFLPNFEQRPWGTSFPQLPSKVTSTIDPPFRVSFSSSNTHLKHSSGEDGPAVPLVPQVEDGSGAGRGSGVVCVRKAAVCHTRVLPSREVVTRNSSVGDQSISEIVQQHMPNKHVQQDKVNWA
jgi:hypothetical protein